MLLVCILIGYFIGSVPTAYLAVRFKSGLDLRKKGSSNVGALNVYDVTKSKWTGIIVGLIDGIKGALVVLIAKQLVGDSFWIQSITLISAIIGHNYPVWLRFHGGRGLASAAGGLFVIGIGYLIVWCIMWFVSNKYLKSVLKANLTAILLAPIILLFIPSNWIEMFMVCKTSAADYRIFSLLLSFVLLLSHWQILKDIIISKRHIS